MNAAIRILTAERRWLSQALTAAEDELGAADPREAPDLCAQVERLASEMSEVMRALRVLDLGA